MERFALVILHYRFREITESCLESLAAARSRPFKIFLINNSPLDGSGPELIFKLKTLGLDHTYLEFGENRGFSGGANAGIREALKEGFSHVALLNNDTRVREDFGLRVSTAIRSDPGRVIAGLVLNAATGLRDHNVGRISPFTLMVRFDYNETPEDGIDMASGAFLVIPRILLETAGLFEEDYFMYYEDVELCLRWKKAGVKIAFHPEIRILHATNSTTDRAGAPKEYYRMRNQTRTVLRHGTPLQKFLYGAQILALLIYKLRHPRVFREFVRGIADAFRGKMGKRDERLPAR